MHKSLQLSRYKDAEVFRKNRYIYFFLFVLLIFDLQDGRHIFQREVTVGWVGTINMGRDARNPVFEVSDKVRFKLGNRKLKFRL